MVSTDGWKGRRYHRAERGSKGPSASDASLRALDSAPRPGAPSLPREERPGTASGPARQKIEPRRGKPVQIRHGTAAVSGDDRDLEPLAQVPGARTACRPPKGPGRRRGRAIRKSEDRTSR